MMMTGTSMIHVPYRGSGPALIDLLASSRGRKPASCYRHIKPRAAVRQQPEAVVLYFVDPARAGRGALGG